MLRPVAICDLFAGSLIRYFELGYTNVYLILNHSVVVALVIIISSRNSDNLDQSLEHNTCFHTVVFNSIRTRDSTLDMLKFKVRHV